MSMVEGKATVAEMRAGERFEVAAFIAHLNRADSSEYQSGLDQRRSTIDAGGKKSAQDLERRRQDLLAQGR